LRLGFAQSRRNVRSRLALWLGRGGLRRHFVADRHLHALGRLHHRRGMRAQQQQRDKRRMRGDRDSEA
jgi:hypothetical protein